MQKNGHPGLSKKPVDTASQSAVRAASANPSTGQWAADGSQHGRLHVITTERRSPNRLSVPHTRPLPPPGGRPYEIAKRCIDVVGALAAAVIFSPLILSIVICAHASGSSAMFKHRRVGRFGRVFDCYKFRTMVPNAEEVLQNLLDRDPAIKAEWLRHHKLRNDPRITTLGRFLRKTSLDELPQLWNVLRGEMSLVGPRPVVPEELLRYGRKVGTFLSARPGITGLWQISGRNDTDYRRRVALDICYIKSRSLLLDVVIILKTLPAVCTRTGAY